MTATSARYRARRVPSASNVIGDVTVGRVSGSNDLPIPDGPWRHLDGE